MKIIIFLFLIVHCTLHIDNCFAQWQPDMRLTNDISGSYTSNNNARNIASSGNDIHIVWQEGRDGNWEIYYKRSTDSGIGWSADIRLTNQTAGSRYPSISVSGQVVHVIWEDFRNSTFEIYYKRSTDGGVSWSTDTQLTIDPAFSGNPSISVTGQLVHVVWDDNRDGNYEIYFKRSTDGGVSWSADTRLINNSGNSRFPCVSVQGLFAHVVWNDNRDGNYEIYYKQSTDGGISWNTDIRLTNNTFASEYPSVSVSNSIVQVVWRDTRDGNREIYCKSSIDGGVNWGVDSRLTNNSANSEYPSVSVSVSNIHIVWNDNRDGNYEIYYKRSTDGGINWGADTRLTTNSATSQSASISITGSIVHIVWCDNRDDGWWEIYYKRDPSGNIVGLHNINADVPKEFSLGQNYPNPFNPVTKIKINIPLLRGVSARLRNGQEGRGVLTSLIIYDILGSEVATLVNEQLKPGTYEVEFDGSKYSSGVYYYKLTAREYTETRKMVLIK